MRSKIPANPEGFISPAEAAHITGWGQGVFSHSCANGEIKGARILKSPTNSSMRRWIFPRAALLPFFKSSHRRALAGRPGSVAAVIKKLEAGDFGPTTLHAAPRGSLGLSRDTNGTRPRPTVHQADAAVVFTQAFVALIRQVLRDELATMLGRE